MGQHHGEVCGQWDVLVSLVRFLFVRFLASIPALRMHPE
jgi:hypothetical protein